MIFLCSLIPQPSFEIAPECHDGREYAFVFFFNHFLHVSAIFPEDTQT